MKTSQLLINAALAGLFVSGSAFATHPTTEKAAEYKCGHSNTCHTTSACKGFGNNSCAGKNSCSGKGYLKVKDEEACKLLCANKDNKDNKDCGKEEAPAKS